jgi:translation elongation factor IF5A
MAMSLFPHLQIFNGKKMEDLSPSTHNMDVPNIARNEYTLLNIDDGFLNLIDQTGAAKDDVKIPDGEIGDQIQQLFDDGKEVLVTVVSAMGEEHALAVKEAPTGVSIRTPFLHDSARSHCPFVPLSGQVNLTRFVKETFRIRALFNHLLFSSCA